MEIKKKNKKTKIVSIIIIAVLVLSIGGAFAAWSNAQFGENQLLVAGNIYMKYNGINQEKHMIQILILNFQ